MAKQIVKLHFKGQVHFGDGRLSDSRFTFDAATLFSALYIEALKAGSEKDLLDAAKTGGLYLSDAFPYVGDTLYLPKPMVQFDKVSSRGDSNNELGSQERKAAKKLGYIAADSLHRFLHGDFDPVAALEGFYIGASEVQTKVNLKREGTDDARPYHIGGFSFISGAGLYFVSQGSFDLNPLLRQLSFSGLGGKRSTGFGRFEYEVLEPPSLFLSDEVSSDASRQMLLSTSAPKVEELNNSLLDGSRYRLVRKGGFVQSATHNATPQKKRDLYEFAAGSVFTRTFEGDIFDVNDTPGAHPVYRYARAMWLEV